MRLRDAVVAGVAAMVVALPARADQPGWYIGAGGGWSTIDNVGTADSSLNFTSTEGHGFGVIGFGGYDFGGLFRAEGEVGYHRHDVKSLSIANDGGLGASLGVGSLTGASTNAGGSISALSFMVNGIVNLLPSWRVSPYVGVGVGGADVSLNTFRSPAARSPMIPIWSSPRRALPASVAGSRRMSRWRSTTAIS